MAHRLPINFFSHLHPGWSQAVDSFARGGNLQSCSPHEQHASGLETVSIAKGLCSLTPCSQWFFLVCAQATEGLGGVETSRYFPDSQCSGREAGCCWEANGKTEPVGEEGKG